MTCCFLGTRSVLYSCNCDERPEESSCTYIEYTRLVCIVHKHGLAEPPTYLSIVKQGCCAPWTLLIDTSYLSWFCSHSDTSVPAQAMTLSFRETCKPEAIVQIQSTTQFIHVKRLNMLLKHEQTHSFIVR